MIKCSILIPACPDLAFRGNIDRVLKNLTTNYALELIVSSFNMRDQSIPFKVVEETLTINGNKVYWWFSDAAIKAHSRNTLVLKP